MGGPGSGRGASDGASDGASKPPKAPKVTLASLAAVVEVQRGEIAALRARVATLEGVAALYTGEAGAGGGGAGQAGENAAAGGAAGGGGQGDIVAKKKATRGPGKKTLAKAGESFRTSIRATLKQRIVSARLNAHSRILLAFECTFSLRLNAHSPCV